MIRIQSGVLKGKVLPQPDPRDARPTTQKVRAAIFNILQHDLPDAVLWDLFSGSGSVGIEGYSRGARAVLFLDSNPRLVRTLSGWVDANLREHRENLFFHTGDVFEFLRKTPDFPSPSITFVDPPYHYPDWGKLLNALCLSDIVNPGSLLVLEYHHKDSLPWESLLDWGCQVLSHHQYGESGVSLLRSKAR